ncbi:MAG: diaminopimelate epimerase [Terriglobales bacterium]
MSTDTHIRFVKAESNGNDFLIVDAAAVAGGERAGFVQRICDRHRGVGADGVEFVRSRGSGFELTLYNADGREAEISGNGTRCVAAFYAKHGFRQGVLETKAGPRQATVLDGAGERWIIEIDLGVPQLLGTEELEVLGGKMTVHTLSMGNPQCIVFVTDFPDNWEALGAALEKHPHFPQGTNVEFVRVPSRQHLDIRIFERGVGPTRSSGTGSTAAAVAAIAAGRARSPVDVATPGGKQRVSWAGSGTPAKLTGPAAVVAEGVFYFEGD